MFASLAEYVVAKCLRDIVLRHALEIIVPEISIQTIQSGSENQHQIVKIAFIPHQQQLEKLVYKNQVPESCVPKIALIQALSLILGNLDVNFKNILLPKDHLNAAMIHPVAIDFGDSFGMAATDIDSLAREIGIMSEKNLFANVSEGAKQYFFDALTRVVTLFASNDEKEWLQATIQRHTQEFFSAVSATTWQGQEVEMNKTRKLDLSVPETVAKELCAYVLTRLNLSSEPTLAIKTSFEPPNVKFNSRSANMTQLALPATPATPAPVYSRPQGCNTPRAPRAPKRPFDSQTSTTTSMTQTSPMPAWVDPLADQGESQTSHSTDPFAALNNFPSTPHRPDQRNRPPATPPSASQARNLAALFQAADEDVKTSEPDSKRACREQPENSEVVPDTTQEPAVTLKQTNFDFGSR